MPGWIVPRRVALVLGAALKLTSRQFVYTVMRVFDSVGVSVACACAGTYHVGGTPRNAIPGWASRPDPSARTIITVRTLRHRPPYSQLTPQTKTNSPSTHIHSPPPPGGAVTGVIVGVGVVVGKWLLLARCFSGGRTGVTMSTHPRIQAAREKLPHVALV
ncbi:MAG: hypothetical protein HS103_06125 [Anaerolineales bacterium]|nr:hypothetical protein [Anaerolineales bacterium]